MNLRELVEKYGGRHNFINEVNTKLLQVADENPDFVYCPSECRAGENVCECSYSGPPIPGLHDKPCIFGHVLQLMGWDDPGEIASDKGISGLIYAYAKKIMIPLYWVNIQTTQDHGRTWGYCGDTLRRELGL